MSLFVRVRPAAAVEERGTVRLPAYLTQAMLATGSTVFVDEDSALRHDAVWSCVNAIAEDVAMMPVDVVRYQSGRRVPVEPVPQIIGAPSVVRVDPMDWRIDLLKSWLLWGNGWGLVTQVSRDASYPTRIELLNPADVQVWDSGAGPQFRVDNEAHDLWPVGDLWHVPAYTMPGQLLGLSPIRYHAATVRTGLSAEKFGGDFFNGGGHPTAVLAPERDPGQDGAARLLEGFNAATANRGAVVVPQSVKYTAIQVNPTDSQFLDTMRYSVEQVCRIFREDPADHGSSGGAEGSITYANRSDADLARFKRRQFWTVKLQNALSALIPRPQFARLNTSSALMMTTRERHELHKLRLDSRTTTVNEVRTIEDEAPFGPEFDEPGIPTSANGDDPDTPEGDTDE